MSEAGREAALLSELQSMVVRELDLKDVDPATLAPDAPLFGEGLGLDSLDALQLAMAIEERYGVVLPEGEDARPIFASLASIAEYVAARR